MPACRASRTLSLPPPLAVVSPRLALVSPRASPPREADLLLAQAVAASLHTAACEQVDLSGTKLIGANFAGAKFSEAMAVGASARAPNSSGP